MVHGDPGILEEEAKVYSDRSLRDPELQAETKSGGRSFPLGRPISRLIVTPRTAYLELELELLSREALDRESLAVSSFSLKQFGF